MCGEMEENFPVKRARSVPEETNDGENLGKTNVACPPYLRFNHLQEINILLRDVSSFYSSLQGVSRSCGMDDVGLRCSPRSQRAISPWRST